ncbi:MAG: response regulator transcription factor [Lachnospiraceae bacterium]|nr:response regulator transcription factor [Lachnospiraceae bacterium]
MNIRIAICDDDTYFIENLCEKLNNYTWGNNINISIHKFVSGNELIKHIKEGLSLDVLFLDIDLKNDDVIGTEFGVQLKKLNPQLLIVYTTFFDKYLLDIAKSEPFDFLPKSSIDSTKELSIIIDKVVRRLHYLKEKYIFHFKSNGNTFAIDLKNIMYFESKHRVIIIHTSNGNTYQFYDKLDNVEKFIEERYPFFVRINKSYYVNFNYVIYYNLSHVEIDGMILNISPQYKTNLMEKLSLFS